MGVEEPGDAAWGRDPHAKLDKAGANWDMLFGVASAEEVARDIHSLLHKKQGTGSRAFEEKRRNW
jgi:hypothetical protein